MTKSADGPVMDVGVVQAVVQDMIELSSALDQVKTYAKGEDVNAQQFGKLAATMGVGANFVALKDTLVASVDKLVPVVNEMTQALADTVKTTTSSDESAASGIRGAGRELSP